MFQRIRDLWSSHLVRDLVLFVTLVIIVLVSGYFLQSCITSHSDKKFDEAEKAKIEQMQRDEADSATHEANAKAQEALINDLEKQVKSMQGIVDQNNRNIHLLKRSRKSVEKTTRANINAASGDMSIRERCLRICASAKFLGYLPTSASCDCQ